MGVCSHLASGGELAIDAAAQIRLFGKLKLAKCARAERRPGHFYVRAAKRLFFSLLFTSETSAGLWGPHESAALQAAKVQCSGSARAA